MSRPELIEDLRKIVTPRNVSDDYFVVPQYCMDNVAQNILGYSKYKPAAVIKPKTIQQVQQLVALANKHKIPLTPRGGGTGYSGGALPTGSGMVVEMRGLNKVVELDVANRLVTVQAGITVIELNRFLKKRGFWWPHDPGSRRWATVGGTISTNGIGTFSTKYGLAKNLAVAIKVVTPQADILQVGSKTRTSDVNYDLLSLILASEGTLGIIVEATLKVFSLPKSRKISVYSFRKFRGAARAAERILDAGLVPESMNIECGNRFTHMVGGRNMAKLRRVLNGRTEAFMIVSVAGETDVVDFETRKIAALCANENGSEIDDRRIVNAYWKAKTILVTPVGGDRKYHSVDLGVPIGRVQDLYDIYIKTCKDYSLEAYGVRYYVQHPHADTPASPHVIFNDDDPDETERFEKWLAKLSQLSPKIDGTMSSILGTGIRLNRFADKELGPALTLARGIKQALDPNNIMNPGKKFP